MANITREVLKGRNLLPSISPHGTGISEMSCPSNFKWYRIAVSIDRFEKQALENNPITIYGDGLQTRSFIYVSNTVNEILIDLEKGEVYNKGNDMKTTILKFANTVREITYSTSDINFKPLPEADPKRRAADVSKMQQLGWSPRISLRKGIQNIASLMMI